jgi:hypothetical protein
MISLGLAVGTCGMAVRYGDQAARRFGGAFLASWLASLAVHTGNGQTVGWVMFCIDCATLGYFVGASRGATTIDLRVAMDTFRMSMALWSYGILTCIGFGAWSSRREPSRAFSIPS